MPEPGIGISTSELELILQPVAETIHLRRLAHHGVNWLHPDKPSGLFQLVINGASVQATDLAFQGVQESRPAHGVRQLTLQFTGAGIRLEQDIRFYENAALIEFQPRLYNLELPTARVERIDSLVLTLAQNTLELLAFQGDWGREFEPIHPKLNKAVVLESRSGRSSKGNHPWCALFRSDGATLSAAVAWSGNWALRLEPQAEGALRFSGGLHDWEFCKILTPGESLSGAPVVLVLGDHLNAVSQQYARVGRQYWYPRNALSAMLPIEWNHWWPYEDVEINEAVFLANVERAAEMGFEVCTLDAGWFGPSDPETFWYDYRGDWHRVNQRRFPNGIRYLADRVHAKGMKFGLWCEIEALGEKASLTQERPDLPAQRDGQLLGYICFGNPQAQEWAYHTLRRLITEFGCDWIKLDFNLDPGAGCNRTDHGHQAGDGLYEHYQGYYRMLERLRRDFPEVVLENCSSGGLRIDLGILRQTHMTFLSDPDWPEHDLHIFWGASAMLAPNVLLHWTFSHWRNLKPPPQQTFDPHDPTLTRQQWDYYTRISMLGLYGLSQKLPELPTWLLQRIQEHNRLYKAQVRRFIRQADLYRLTDQPLRSGAGDRWAAFQYSMPDQSEHLLFVFRLPGGEPQRFIRMCNLQPYRDYRVQGLEGEHSFIRSGASLMAEGLYFDQIQEQGSALLWIH